MRTHQWFSMLVLLLSCSMLLLASPSPQALPQATEEKVPRPDPLAGVTDRASAESKADLMMLHKEYRDAIQLYQKGLQFEPRNAVLYNKLGIAWHQLVRLSEAKRCYERAIRLNPRYSEAINNLGTIFYSAKKYSKAIHQYERAIKLNDASASFYSNLGTAWFARKKYKKATEAYYKAVQIDPDVFERKGSFGVEVQERSVEDRARFHFYLAKTYALAGDMDHAILYLRKALEEGFKDRDKIPEDPDFARLVKTEGYAQLMQNPPVAIPQ